MADKQSKLALRLNEYPQRPKWFAFRFQRLIAKVCAAQDIGCEGFAILVIVSQTEFSRRYSSPPTFYNSQLRSYLGFENDKKLRRAREKCESFGWLHYEPGGKGRPGVYWVTIPPCYELIDDYPLGEGTEFQGQNGTSKRPESGTQTSQEAADKWHSSLGIRSSSSTTTSGAVAAAGEIEELTRRLAGLGIGMAKQTATTALVELKLDAPRIHEIIGYFESQLARYPGQWTPGALRSRLTNESSAFLAPDQGWPAPDRRAVDAALLRQQTASCAVERQQLDESRLLLREKLRQLELQFGPEVDALPPEQLVDLLTESCPGAVKEFRRLGADKARKAPMIRPLLLRAFEQRYGAVPACEQN